MAAPGPVPALPDTERRTQHAIVAGVGPLDVGFALYGDNTDYTAWVEVYVDGVLTPYFLTSASGSSLSNLPRPIVDAQITFLTAQTGTVQIVGARRPRRASQLTENQGLPARDLNQIVTDLVAQSREAWDLRARTIQGVPGDTFPVLTPVARAGKNLAFDALGNLVLLSFGVTSPPIASLSNGLIFDTRGLAALATIGPSVTFIQTFGFSAVADYGAATYARAIGSSPGGFQTADGQWWKLAGLGTVTPQMFGAVANTEAAAGGNSTALAAAMNYLTLQSGGTLLITPHSFYVDAEILVPNNVSVLGVNVSISTLKTTSATAHVLHLAGQGIQIADLQINTNGVTKTAGAAVFLGPAAGQVSLNRLYISWGGAGISGGLFNGIEVDSSVRWHVNDCHIFNVHNDGILIYGTPDLYTIRDSTVEYQGISSDTKAGIEISGNAGDSDVTGCQFVGTQYGIHINTGAGANISESRFSRVLCDHCYVGMIVSAVDSDIARFSFSECDFSASQFKGVALDTSGTGKIRGITFEQCKFILTVSGDGLAIEGTGCRDITVNNCLAAGNVGSGIRVFAGISYFIITNSQIGAFGAITGNGNLGVLIDAGASNHYIVANNLIIGNISAQFTDGGTGVNKSVSPNILV